MPQGDHEQGQAHAISEEADDPGDQDGGNGQVARRPSTSPARYCRGRRSSLSTRRSGEGRRARPCGSGCCPSPRRCRRRQSPPARPGSTASAARTTTRNQLPRQPGRAMPSAIRRSKFSWKMNHAMRAVATPSKSEHQRRGARFGACEARHQRGAGPITPPCHDRAARATGMLRARQRGFWAHAATTEGRTRRSTAMPTPAPQ